MRRKEVFLVVRGKVGPAEGGAQSPPWLHPDPPAMPETARRIVLASRPVGEPKPSDFRLEEFPVPQPGPGQLLLRTEWLSLDPYMRGRMSDAPSYAKPVAIGEVMEGGTVGKVVASNSD